MIEEMLLNTNISSASEDAQRMAEIEAALQLQAPQLPARQTSAASVGTAEIDAMASAAAASVPPSSDSRAREWAETQRRIAENKKRNQAKRDVQSEKNAAIIARLEGAGSPESDRG